LLQRTGKGKRFDRKNRNMTLAAVAGAAFFTGDILAIPLTDVIAQMIDLRDQLLIISERLQFSLLFFTDFDKTGPVFYTLN
jgi:hypothetical protein